MLPAPIRPVVQCFVPGLRDVEANRALRKTNVPKRDRVDDPVRRKTRSSDLNKKASGGSDGTRKNRKIADDVKCGMCGYVVEDLWLCVSAPDASQKSPRLR